MILSAIIVMAAINGVRESFAWFQLPRLAHQLALGESATPLPLNPCWMCR